MAFVLDLRILPPAMLTTNAKLIQAYASQLLPTADFSKGTALYDLLIRPAAILQSIAEVNVNRARLAGSLLSVSQYPDVADEQMVDELLSNYRMTRKAGTQAAGTVQIIVSANVVTAVPSGSVFTSGSLRFFTTQSYVGVPDQSMVSTTSDRLITPYGTGAYSFLVEVQAETEGSEYQLSQGTTLVMQTPPSNYITSKAAYDFSTGIGGETNEEMIARMPSSLANRTPGNRTNIQALIQESFPDVTNVATVGYGQSEMTRDQDNLFLFSYGGKSDIYVQSALRPQLIRVRKSAVLVNSNGTWQASFDRDEFAGAYKLSAVLPVDQTSLVGTFKITSEIRAIATDRPEGSPDAFVPHIDNVMQGSFSRYQTLAVEFLDTNTSTTGMTPMVTTREYYFDLLVMPGIAAIQDQLFSDPDIRAHRYDDLVRAPIPVLVSITIGLRLKAGDSANVTAISQAIADRINRLGFRSSLSSSYAIDTAHDLIGTGSSVIMPIDMLGELIDPADGASRLFRSSSTLTIPTDYDKQISEKTVMFFCDPKDVAVYIERA